MTVLVGVRCTNGVVIGCDSAITYAPIPDPNHLTAEAQVALKIAVVQNDVLIATTGEVGLGQRFVHLVDRVLQGQVQVQGLPNLRAVTAVEAGTLLSTLGGQEFNRTRRPWEQAMALGALVGMVLEGQPRLYWFDPVYFRSELVGETDPNGVFKTLPLATAGSGQRLADPFLLHAHRVLFGEAHFPTVADGRLLVAYTLDHVIRYNTGTVGGDPHVATLEMLNGAWGVRHSNIDEIRQQVQTLEAHVRGHQLAAAGVPDVNAALAAPAQNP